MSANYVPNLWDIQAIGAAIVFVTILLPLVIMTWRERCLLSSLTHSAFCHAVEDINTGESRFRVPEAPINIEMLRLVARFADPAVDLTMRTTAAVKLVKSLVHIIPVDQRSLLWRELKGEEGSENWPSKSPDSSLLTFTKRLDFLPGDKIVYPTHGLGRIMSIETQVVAGAKLESFVIAFEKDGMILRVPINKAIELGMRALSSPEVISQVMNTLKSKPRVNSAVWSRRVPEYEQKINSGDLIAIAEVVRDLHRGEDRREQSYSECRLYETALERLTREFAAVEVLDEFRAKEIVIDALTINAA